MTSSGHPHFDRLVAKAKTLQSRLVFLPTVAVGGTAVAIYAKHRVSLDAVEVDGLWVPTLPELLRVKAYLLSDRRAVRDFIDVCALVRTAGQEASLAAMESFDALYGGLSTAGALTAFAEAAHDDPVDMADVDPASWRSLDPAYRDVAGVVHEVRQFAISAVHAAANRRHT